MGYYITWPQGATTCDYNVICFKIFKLHAYGNIQKGLFVTLYCILSNSSMRSYVKHLANS